MAGKGSKIREGLNLTKFSKRLEEIDFSKHRSDSIKKIIKKGNKTTYVFK